MATASRGMKAKFIRTYIWQGRRYGEYEYRNAKYSVCLDWNAESPAWQHRNEQALIDKRIESAGCQTTENAQTGLDLFFEITQ